MPHNFSMLDTQFPHFEGDESTDAKIKRLQDYLFMLLEQLKYMLYNLDSGNFNDAALQELMDSLKEGIETNVVISNTVITENLYAEYGDIAELTVDRLLTANKVARYQDSDSSDINYIWIQDQSIKLMTGTTDGSTTQHRDRNGVPLYWYDAERLGIGTQPTAYPVMVYEYAELTKASIGFDNVGGVYVPRLILGAGWVHEESGQTRERALLHKGTDGLEISHVAANGERAVLRMNQFVDATMRRIVNVDINKSAGTVSYLMEGGDEPVALTFTETASGMTFTWPDGHKATVTIS